jgi:hypothetical protein
VGGEFTSIGGQTRNDIAALDATTGLATAWDPDANNAVLALALSGATVYAGGRFSGAGPTIGGQSRNHIAALDATTGLATAWNPNASQSVEALAVSGSTVYAGGVFGTIGGLTRRGLAALDAVTGVPTAWDWNPTGPARVEVLAVSGSIVYAGGLFGTLGGQTRHNVAALDDVTGAALAWDPDANDLVDAIDVSGATVYVGGLFTVINGQPQTHIAAMNDATTPTLLSLVDAQANPDRIRLTWFAAEGRSLDVTVYRRTVVDDWRSVARTIPNGTGQVVYEDTEVSQGIRYGYRLGVLDHGHEEFLGETWLEVPRSAAFTLSGLRPNPASTEFAIAFSLPDASPARLEVLDVAGRRMVALEVGQLGPGNHVVNLTDGRSLPAGVYALRLTRGQSSLTSRAVVVR